MVPALVTLSPSRRQPSQPTATPTKPPAPHQPWPKKSSPSRVPPNKLPPNQLAPKEQAVPKWPPPLHPLELPQPQSFTTEATQKPYSSDDEFWYIVKLLVVFALVTLLPAMLMVLYLVLNPEAFTTDITPKYDFANWQLGQRPQLLDR